MNHDENLTASPELLERAGELVIGQQAVSKSLLQRHFSLGHRAAAHLCAQLQRAGVVTPVTFAGFRLLEERHRRRTLAPLPAQQVYVRTLRDLALYLVEADEEGGAGHTDFMCELLLIAVGRKALDSRRPAVEPTEVRNVALPVLRAPTTSLVYSIANEIATIPGMKAKWPIWMIGDYLIEACAAVDQRIVDGAAQPRDDHARRSRSYVRLARYLELCILAENRPSTQAFRWLPYDVPFGVGLRVAAEGGESQAEHVVPLLLLARKCTELLLTGVPLMQVACWMQPYMAIIEIKRDEAHYLNDIIGWEHHMPPNWEFDRDSIYARLEQAEIGFTPARSDYERAFNEPPRPTVL